MENRLQHDGWEITVSPKKGAAILSCRYNGVDILRPYAGVPSEDFDAFNSGGFCLVPFSNRIAGGTFKHLGRHIKIGQTRPDFPNPIHGYGWLSAWELLPSDSGTLVLKYRFAPGDDGFDWPWAFEAVQSFAAAGGTLTHALSVTNLSGRTMPAGLGFHPYFPNIDTAHLTASAQSVWRADKAGLPADLIAVPENWDFSTGRSVAGTQIDNCFKTGTPNARISYTDSDLALKLTGSENLKFAVIYTGAGDGSFCYEPVTHMNNALNFQSSGSQTGMEDLAPGQSQYAAMQYIINA